ncbi:hypothetical protein FACS18949_04400 [Clostridia bacterium]|nr:hypothetical protein FACS189425_06500 [Clostridia bacterium]GHV32693.1 hypothetical protein FACS18949_04400 [Clostridia bacterium]
MITFTDNPNNRAVHCAFCGEIFEYKTLKVLNFENPKSILNSNIYLCPDCLRGLHTAAHHTLFDTKCAHCGGILKDGELSYKIEEADFDRYCSEDCMNAEITAQVRAGDKS